MQPNGCLFWIMAEAAAHDVFKALADPTRRKLLDNLNVEDGQTLQQLCEGMAMARQSVSKHLAVLEDAQLVTTVRRGREKLHYLNAAPINAIADRWITKYARERVTALADLKTALESTTMSKPSFVYTTYIHTTPEQLWVALTDPAFTGRYWGATFATDWKPGSTMTWGYAGVTIEDPEQVVLESDPFKRLSYTWQSTTDEFGKSVGFSDELVAKLQSERRSKIAFEIEPVGDQVKLTVIHDDFDEDSAMLPNISGGWPMVLSALKTLLETGDSELAMDLSRRQRERAAATASS
jgi:DNA-binding transcriptional ArsR family regulator/uncharacterized protein YndB with AHSA1/START domain